MFVTMHYVQYLSITYKIVIKRKEEILNKRFNINYSYIFIVLFYGVIMTFFSLYQFKVHKILELLILIPILGQLLHFYLDSLLWKFGDKHNRDVTMRFIKH